MYRMRQEFVKHYMYSLINYYPRKMSTSRNSALPVAHVTTKFWFLHRFLNEWPKYISRKITTTWMTYPQIDSSHVSSRNALLVVIRLKTCRNSAKISLNRFQKFLRSYTERNFEDLTLVSSSVSDTSSSQFRIAAILVVVVVIIIIIIIIIIINYDAEVIFNPISCNTITNYTKLVKIKEAHPALGDVKNLFACTANKVRFDKNICESDG